MNLKKLSRNLLLLLLTIGASLILGFLSFGGMFALWPILPLALAAFGLSVAYEGEIYWQNIKGAINKLFKSNFLKHQLANEFLLQHLLKPADTVEPDAANESDAAGMSIEQVPLIASAKAPQSKRKAQFFIDYEIQLALLREFGHKHLNKESRIRKKQIEKTLRDMEKWFALQVFSNKGAEGTGTRYELEMLNSLDSEEREKYKALLTGRAWTFHAVKAFSILAGAFMSLGTTYLLVEAMSIIPFFAALSFAALPVMIVPMALVAGAAYGFLTYNAVTDMISNDTLNKWRLKLLKDLKEKPVRGVIMTIAAVILVGLAVALTICTAGTWWTIAQETRPLFTWMSKMPGFIMGIINPIITGLSAVVFNLQNSSETLEIAHSVASRIGAEHPAHGHSHGPHANEESETHAHSHHTESPTLLQRENWGQVLNPFRLLLKLTIMPLRALLFLGHLISIGVTADRVPGMPVVLSALLGIVSEGFEDFHYFFGHDHHDHGTLSQEAMLKERLTSGHGHNHNVDLPTRVLKTIFLPVYLLATAWDSVASLWNKDTDKRVLSLPDAWKKQMGIHNDEDVTIDAQAPRPSAHWQVAQTVYRTNRFKEKHAATVGRGVTEALSAFAAEVESIAEPTGDAISAKLAVIKHNRALDSHRFFGTGKTAAREFTDALPERIQLGLVN